LQTGGCLMKNKAVIILCVCAIGILIIALIPKNVDKITNAVVNTENGDVAFCYLDFSQNIAMIRVVSFDKDGKELFSKNFFSDGGSYCSMIFYENVLCLYISRTEKAYFLDRNGDSAKCNAEILDIKNSYAFEGWEKSFGKWSFPNGEYTYIYESPTLFKHSAKLTITKGEDETTVYTSP
jgi:hypothetical protein